jgi:dCMP deaminase|tara:strand:+ start:16 stop:417 length:402 start_codon:yes stop_codon:yes gene_type:complete
MKNKFIKTYMEVAESFAKLSSAVRLQVGAIVVKDDRIISIGYNGMPSGWDNCCEDDNKTKAEVLHAETNAVAKLAKSSESGLDATMFVTHAPCIDCAKLVYQSGIATVYYKNNYRSTQGLDFLIKSDVNVIKV